MSNMPKNYFWIGIKHNILPCCIMFFENEWQSIKKNMREYGNHMHIITNNQGIILCPECLINTLAHKYVN